ncbi:hypothetical protein E1B28_002709 [Marasmius oreades]|uniref:Cytochrome P450 n=1 Tax=Marasmius oreades TaxID=181124 RepID=A0A9P7UP78_9AGAR|nr:uncharacterized protein E1B28_002709 [Marasmius oreades]KAG7086779.1 hypothetical protein E1B28_002709 [Marasmius oreades]
MNIFKSFVLLAVSLLFLCLFVNRYRRGLHLPPGPKGLPVVGNFLDVQRLQKSNELPWVTYTKWSHIYGDIFTFHVLGSRTIVLNSYKAIMELLDRRSHNYSDRPYQPMLNDLVRWKWMFAFMHYSDWWRLHRRTFHQFFQPRVVSDYYEIQKERTSLLIQNLATSPKDFFEHVRAHSGGIILEITYGYRTQDEIDPYIKLVDVAMVGMNASGLHGTYWVDYFPMLRHVPFWFPGASFRTRAEAWARDTDRLINIPWKLLKERMNEGDTVPCFATRNLEKFKLSPTSSNDSSESVMEEVIKDCAANSFLAAAETTVSAILSFILAMMLNPQIQARAQKELDEITDSNRLPDFTDRANLPYIDAVLSETLRWNPVTPLGRSLPVHWGFEVDANTRMAALPHRALNDDVYEGHLIPKGSTIIPNAWAVLRDESLYGPDTQNFDPDRFLKQDGKNIPPNPELLAFGFGRRVCPGRYLAINSLWLAMTYLLASYTMAKEIDPVVEYSSGITSCRFIPRSSVTSFN